MNIAVIAANGKSGQAFVEAALATGHTIHGGVRGEHYLPRHHNLSIIPCDATDKTQLRTLIEGQDAVVSLIGHVKDSPADVQTIAIQNAIDIMKELGIKRIISLTGTGVRFPEDRITLIDRILNSTISFIDPDRINDGKKHAELLAASGLDWTLIRVLKLQNTAPQPFTLREHGPTKLYVSRRDVASAILEVLEHNSFVGKAPILGAS